MKITIDLAFSPRQKRVIRSALVAGSVIGALGLGVVIAAPKNTFTAGTAISASQMNENFVELDTRVASAEQRIAALEGRAPSVTSTSLAGPATLSTSTLSASCTTSKKHLLVLATGTAQLVSGSTYVQVALSVGGVQVASTYSQAAGPRMAIPTMSAFITPAATGAHAIQISNLQGAVFDNRDFWTITCVELP